MGPNKIKWFLGSASLAMIMEQDRKHWLMKTDKKKQVQDKITGDIFQGRIDNLGSDIIIETEKLPIRDRVVKNTKFAEERVANVLEVATSAFPYIPKMNGLMMTRLTSINLASSNTDEFEYKNFRMRLENCEKVNIPISTESGDSFVFKWWKTSTAPILEMMDETGAFNIQVPVVFSEGVTNPVFYYPVEDVLRPFEITSSPKWESICETIMITDDEAIGYPLFWFTCDESNRGPECVILNNQTKHKNSNLLEPGYTGSGSKYRIRLYPCTGEKNYNIPKLFSGISSDNSSYCITCIPAEGVFENNDSDFNIPVKDICFVKKDGDVYGESMTIRFSSDSKYGTSVIRMSKDVGWEYHADKNWYEVNLGAFTSNAVDSETKSPLISAFDVQLDTSIAMEDTTTDTGYAGIRMGSSKNYFDQFPRYPHDIEKMDGLPEWVRETTDESSPQHLSVFAIHNTPSYSPMNQNSRQVAGLIFDPGVERDFSRKYHPGQYRITKVDIIEKGSGYQPHIMDGEFGRVYARFNDGTRSNTYFAITEVDENGGVLAINPLYADEGDSVGPLVNDNYQKPVNGSWFEIGYDPIAFTGAYLPTMWETTKYDEDTLKEYRQQELDGGSGNIHTDDNLEDTNWRWYTSATGTGLVIRIRAEYLETVEEPYTQGNVPTEEIGRVYLLSNDDTEYRNNAKAENPKPERTIARICDIPTSVMQLTNISGIAPTSIVDKQYVRSEAPFTEKDLERLYNGVRDKWVKPTHLDSSGQPIYTPDSNTQSNQFIFDSLENLKKVDLVGRNDFRYWENLNGKVDPNNVSVYRIAKPGEGYTIGSKGTIIVGGFAFHYEVMGIDSIGGVTDVQVAPANTVEINLSNFDMIGNSGYTSSYGTSPLENQNGTGLRIQFKIDNYSDLLPKKGKIVEGLFAFVKDQRGIWLYRYENGSTLVRDKGSWKSVQLVSESNSTYTTGSSNGVVSTCDSYINSILPSVRELPIAQLEENKEDTTIQVMQTASFINVIDTRCTPVWIPDESDSSRIDERRVVDFNKFYCRTIGTLIADQKTTAGVIKALKDAKIDRFDSFVFWKWQNKNNPIDKKFTYGIVRRSFNNLMSTATTTLLPENDLVNPRFVHTNAGTTIVWNVPHIGPMMWVFNPKSTIREKYYVNAHTRDLYIVREQMRWDNLEITNADRTQSIKLCSDGMLQYNILTNSPYLVSREGNRVLYQQPDYSQMLDLTIGSSTTIMPTGNWELVFPEIHSFNLKLINENGSATNITPTRMQILRGTNMSNVSDVLNEEGLPVNYKTLLLDETDLGQVNLRLYNHESEKWESV